LIDCLILTIRKWSISRWLSICLYRQHYSTQESVFECFRSVLPSFS